MADMFADWKAANDAKAKARQKRHEADEAKKKRDEAWAEYDKQYGNYKSFGAMGGDWKGWLDGFVKKYDAAAAEWLKADADAHAAELAAVDAVKTFNLQLPPDAPLMPMDF